MQIQSKVTEAYHESFCLFHAHLMGSLPDHCNCEHPAWASYKETDDTHGEIYNETIADMGKDSGGWRLIYVCLK